MSQDNSKYFLVKRSQLTTSKLFVEFYLPEYQEKLNALAQTPYPLKPLKGIASRLFDGPFGSNRKVDMYQESGIPYIRVKDVLTTGIDLTNVAYISEEKHQELGRSRVVPGNVLITIAGRVGTTAVFPDSLEEGNITGHIAGLELPDDINPHYVAAFLNTQFGEFQIARLSHRTTRPEMNLKEVGSILVSVPPRPIQDQIAQVMQEAYDNRLKKTKEADILLEGIDSFVLGKLGIDLVQVNRQKSFLVPISQLIGQRFDVESVSNRFSVQDYPHVSWTTLNKIASLPTNTKIPSRHPEQTFTYIGMTDVDNIYGEVNSQNLLGKNIKANKIVIQGNDLVFARIEPCVYNLKIALIPENIDEALGSTELLIARPKSDVIPEFLLWILRSELIQRQIAGKVTGTTGRRRLPNSIFASLKIPQISLELQKSIADEAMQRRDRAKQLKLEAEAIVSAAKVRVEKMILGEEVADGE